jgi:hypothetical protein
MDEFASNLRIFAFPRRIHHAMDNSLLDQENHQLPHEDLLKLRIELRVAERFGEMMLSIDKIKTRIYKGIDPTSYGGVPIPGEELKCCQDEIWIN